MNSVILIGNLTRDPESRTTASGINVCNFTVAVSRNFRNANGDVETDFIPVVVWRGQAENCGKYLKKGSKVAVSGDIQTSTYEATDGTKRYTTEVVANSVEFLTPKGQSSGGYNVDDIQDLEPVKEEELPF